MQKSQTGEWPDRSVLIRSVEKLEHEDPRVAAVRVPSGVTRYWGFVLDWPDWLWEGTSFSERGDLPQRLALSEDLRLLANLCSQCGYLRLLTLLVQMRRAPGEKQDVHAPDLRAALESKIRWISLRNPQVDCRIKNKAQHAQIEIDIDETAGAFSTFYQTSLLVVLYRLVRSFAGYAPDQAALLGQLEMHTTISDQKLLSGLGELLQCTLKGRCKDVVLQVPNTVLALKSPEYDISAWQSGTAQFTELEHKNVAAQPLSKNYLRRLVQADLRETGRARTLVQLADSLGISERSLSRSLTEQGTSLKSIKTLARMDRARELLQDPALSLGQISARLAYSETSSFVRAFRKHFGETPGRWRIRQMP